MLKKMLRFCLAGCLVLCIFSVFLIDSVKVNAESVGQDTIQIDLSSLHIETNGDKEIAVDAEGNRYTFITAEGSILNARDVLAGLWRPDYGKEEFSCPLSQRGESNPTNTYEMATYYAALQTTGSKVTPYVAGPATITYGTSVTTTESFSSSMAIGGSLKVIIRSKFTATAGLTWNNSSSSSTTFSATFTVDSGKIGAVYFFPLLRYVIGYYYDSYGNPTRIDANYPIKLVSGFTDGLYTLIQN
jgi:hypothetical protein